MGYIIKILAIVLIVLLLLVALQLAKIFYYTGKVRLNIHPFQKYNPQAKFKVLFAGDSTGVGTGATDNSQSTAGWLSREFPEAHIENYSKNGLRLHGLIDILGHLKQKSYDLAILQIGANDILYFTNLKSIKKDQQRVLQLTKNIAKKIIILHSGDVGKAPIFHWPLSWIYHWRSLAVRDIYMKSQDEQVSYVDIYELWGQLKGDMSVYYASDQLHLSDQGYRLWYDFIKSELSQEKED